ncbi:hypothetical protein HHI36_019360 [Cryptolaemus montrouzieri]|uniref:MADF domain-containing protein n=1 Tax=Cryptolaemus montrouzieri TaxID=559131 RepID=A0ABD2P2T6_9CUCU
MCQRNITFFEELANLLNSEKQEFSKEYCLKINPKNHWITPDYLNLMEIRDRKYVKWKQVQNDITKKEFRMAKNAVNDIRRKLKRQNTEDRFNPVRGNSKKTWNVLNNLCGRMRKDKNEIKTQGLTLIYTLFEKIRRRFVDPAALSRMKNRMKSMVL